MIRPRLPGGSAPALCAAAALGAGVAAGAFGTSGEALALVGAALLLLPPLGRRHFQVGLFLLLGFASGRSRIAAPAARAWRAAAQLDGELPVTVTGRLASFWSGQVGARRVRLESTEVCQRGSCRAFPADVDVWLGGGMEPPGRAGDIVSPTGHLAPPEIPASDRELPAPAQRYSLRVKSALAVTRLNRTAISVLKEPNEWLWGRLERSGISSHARGRIGALLLGRFLEDEPELDSRLRLAGLAHLLVGSGLHAGILLALAAAALYRMPRRGRDAVLLLLAAGLLLASGGRAGVVRATVTIAILLVSRLLERPITSFQAIGASALVILLCDPASLFSAGFFLTYSAALGIAGLAPGLAAALRGRAGAFGASAAVVAAAQIATAPLVLWRFNVLNAVAWLASPLLLPAVTLLLVEACAVVLLAACGISPELPARGFDWTALALERVAGLGSRGAILAATPPFWTVLVLLSLAALVAVGLPRAIRLASAAAYAVLLVVLVLRSPSAAGLSVEALDVGQGDAILLRSGAAAFLIDGGGGFDAAGESFGYRRLVPKLLDRGVRRLDAVMLSHPHPDHAFGLLAVLEEMSVGTFLRGAGPDEADFFCRLEESAREHGAAVRVLRTGERFPWARGMWTILRAGEPPSKKDPVNNGSVVALFEGEGRRLLFPGDAGASAESDLVGRGLPGPVDLLKVGHHGSRSSTTDELLAAARPRAALLSCGRHNRFGHPAPETIARLERAGVPVFRTDRYSDVGIRFAPGHLFVFARGLR
jgi:competence protein ComEC